MYENRREAGRGLATVLAGLDVADPVVVGIPRGGLLVAAGVAEHLSVPVSVMVVRKLPCPWYPRLGMGAVAEGGLRLLNRDVIERYGVEPHDVAYVTQAARREVEDGIARYRSGAARVSVTGSDVVLVDDGMVTGFTALAAVATLRAAGARHVVVAAPVASKDAIKRLRDDVEDLVVPSPIDWLDDVDRAYLGGDAMDERALRSVLHPILRSAHDGQSSGARATSSLLGTGLPAMP